MLSDDDFRTLLAHFDLPWAGYRKVRKGVKKRIWRQMQEAGCGDIHSYLVLVEQRQDVRARCRHCLLVTISRFFRDRRLWDYLHAHLLPELKKLFPAGLNAWSAGCAGGEEPYSLAMVWAEAVGGARFLRIIATDANPESLKRARLGIYDEGSLKEVPEELRQSYFLPMRHRRWAIKPHLRKGIAWELHNILDEPPGRSGPFHLVFLRNNLLTYYQGEALHAALDRITKTIAPDGLLIVGSHERLPEVTRPFVRDEGCPWVYRF